MSAIGKCPWCGGEPDFRFNGKYYIHCRAQLCAASGPFRHTKEEAIAAWNRLATPGQGEVPTDTPALLPPDPSVPGRYWISASFDEIWTWHPDVQRWHAPGWTPNRVSPELAASLGCTFAKLPARPIPGPAALEAVWKVIGSMDQLSADFLARRERYKPDSYAHGTCDGQAAAYATAANWLRAALETKETT